ncbi:MAG: ABC transporter substrate-binding protein [Deltaproteobacteria bacterium]|nr:ABC transporter substrate-binding protein [Deltaproteobacteria bacterium]
MSQRYLLLVFVSIVISILPAPVLGAEKSIIIGEAVRGVMYAPVYIAEEKGYFKKRSFDSKIVTFSGGNNINALVAGDIQFAALSPDSVIRGSLAGYKAKMIMGMVRGLNLALAVQPEIKSAGDLKGKSIGISDFSGLPYTALLLSLKELGLKKEDVTYLKTGGKSLRYQALLAKRVHGVILDPPYTTMAQKEGFRLIVDLTRLDVPYLRTVIAVSEKNLHQDAGTVTRFVEAVSEGIQFYREKANREESIRILGKYLRVPLDKGRAMLEEGYETYREMTLKKPYPDANGLQIVLETIAEANPKAKNVHPGQFIDGSFVERLDREGFFERKGF